MQILPAQTKTNQLSNQAIAGLSSSSSVGSQFAELISQRCDALRQSMSAMSLSYDTASDMASSHISQQAAASQSPVVQAALPVQPTTSVQNTAQAVLDSARLDAMRDVKMSQEDYAELRPKLEKAGMSKEDLDEVQKKIASPEGITWGQFVSGLKESVSAQVTGKVELTDQDKQSLTGFFTRLGFDSKQAQEMVDGLASGKSDRVMGQVRAKLASLNEDEMFSVPADETQALAKALKLSPEAQSRLAPLFDAMDKGILSAKELSQAFAAVKGEVSKQQALIEEAMSGVRNAVGEVISNSSDRLGLARQAMNAQVEAKQLSAGSNQDNLQANPNAAKDQDPSKANANDPRQAAQNQAQNAKNDAMGLGGQQASGKNAGQDQKSAQEKAWSDFWGKTRLEADASQTTGQSALGKGLGFGTATQGQAGVQARGGDVSTSRAQGQSMLDQVENGILRNLGQGVKQLSLELSPDNLGKLNLVLTVKGKDVQAIIKAESPEASKFLSENLAQVKESLERQGLTVSKLEVRTGLSQDSNLGQQWSGADQHNQAQERRDALGRMRVGSLLGGTTDILAQDMQSRGVTEKNSQSGLDLIA